MGTTATSDSAPAPIPWEGGDGIVRRFLGTLAALVRAPGATFLAVPEPIEHGRVLGLLALVRLPAWFVWVLLTFGRGLARDPGALVHTRPPAAVLWLDPTVVSALAPFCMLMVPIGLPILYFSTGILAHVALALTGGARQSVGATMRAGGYAMVPGLLLLSLLDPAAALGLISADAFGVATAVAVVAVFGGTCVSLARTHRTSLVRAALVALLPALLLAGVTLARSSLVLPAIPFGPEPVHSPYVPLPPP
jgi:hypothetical protein